MTTLIVSHEAEDGNKWAKAWKRGAGSRHEMFAKIGVKVRTFRDASNHNMTGVILEVPDMKKFDDFMSSDEGKKAVAEDTLKPETFRILAEFTP